MKKKICLLIAIVVLVSSFALTGCGKDCDHSFGNWTTTKTATCTEEGQKERTCSECGETESKTIEAPGHNYVDGICTECGSSK